MTERTAINELRRYVIEDKSYRENSKPKSDFDKFCETHIKSIEVVLKALHDNNKKTEELSTQLTEADKKLNKYINERKRVLKRLNTLKNKNLPCDIFNKVTDIISILEE